MNLDAGNDDDDGDSSGAGLSKLFEFNRVLCCRFFLQPSHGLCWLARIQMEKEDIRKLLNRFVARCFVPR